MASVKTHGMRTHSFRLEGSTQVKQSTAEFKEVSEHQRTTKTHRITALMYQQISRLLTC